MRKRKDLEDIIFKYAGPEQGLQQQVAATVIAVEILLDIRDLLLKQNREAHGLSDKHTEIKT